MALCTVQQMNPTSHQSHSFDPTSHMPCSAPHFSRSLEWLLFTALEANADGQPAVNHSPAPLQRQRCGAGTRLPHKFACDNRGVTVVNHVGPRKSKSMAGRVLVCTPRHAAGHIPSIGWLSELTSFSGCSRPFQTRSAVKARACADLQAAPGTAQQQQQQHRRVDVQPAASGAAQRRAQPATLAKAAETAEAIGASACWAAAGGGRAAHSKLQPGAPAPAVPCQKSRQLVRPVHLTKQLRQNAFMLTQSSSSKAQAEEAVEV